jgi:mannosyltransferase
MSLQIDGIIFSLQQQGGISVYFRELMACLARHGEDFTLSLEMPTLQDAGPPSGRALTRAARRLERVRRCRPTPGATVLHSSYYRQPAAPRVASVITVYDFIHERYRSGWARRAFMQQKRAAILSAEAVICISQATCDDLLEWVGTTPGQSLHVIHCGVSEVFRPLAPTPPSRPYVLYVGERRGYKNFRLVLGAMSLLRGYELHCVGGGVLRAEELQSASTEVRERVRHIGFVDDEALNRHYNSAVCLAYPSSYEGFGIPVIEAMRAGCPVVATSCKAVLEVGGDALTVADSVDPAAVAAAIERTADSNHRETIIQAGFRVARAYDWDTQHRRTMDVYRTLGWTPSCGR